MKDVFYFIQKALFLLKIFKFLYFLPPLFFSLSHCFRAGSKMNLKDIIRCLNKNLITQFV